jgi:hypothetical protein
VNAPTMYGPRKTVRPTTIGSVVRHLSCPCNAGVPPAQLVIDYCGLIASRRAAGGKKDEIDHPPIAWRTHNSIHALTDGVKGWSRSGYERPGGRNVIPKAGRLQGQVRKHPAQGDPKWEHCFSSISTRIDTRRAEILPPQGTRRIQPDSAASPRTVAVCIAPSVPRG